MRKPRSKYVSNPEDSQAWLQPDLFLERDQTRQSYERAIQAVEQILSESNRHDVPSDFALVVPNWKNDIQLTVVFFWYGHVQAVEKPRLVAEDARTFQKHLAEFGSAIETLPIPLWKAFDVSASGSVNSLTEEVSVRLKALNAICEVLIEDKRTSSRAGVIRDAVDRIKALLEKIVGRNFKSNLRMERIRKDATNAEKRRRQFLSFDAFFVQAVMHAIDPNVTPHQIRHALGHAESQG